MRLFLALFFIFTFNLTSFAQQADFEKKPLTLVQEYSDLFLDSKEGTSIKQESTLAFLVSISNSQVTDVKHLATKRPSKLKLASVPFPKDEVAAITKYLRDSLKLSLTGDDKFTQQQVIYVDVSRLNANDSPTISQQY